MLTTREVGKLVLRDRRVNDPYSNAHYLRRLAAEGTVDVLAVATRAYQAYLEQEGVETELVPLGYHPSHGRLLDRARDIDAIFLGDFRLPRRRRILRRLEREGVDVLTLGDYSNPELWGEGRVELMNRAKIALNIPRLEGHLPDVRLVVAMANGALVVSEPLYLPEPYEPGVHYIEAPIERLAETVREYVADDDARRRITGEAHRFVTTELTLERSFAGCWAGRLAACGVKDVRPDYYARLHAVETEHWWHVGMRDITATLLPNGSSRPLEPARRGMRDGRLSGLGRRDRIVRPALWRRHQP